MHIEKRGTENSYIQLRQTSASLRDGKLLPLSISNGKAPPITFNGIVVFANLKSDETIATSAEKLEVHPNQIAQWTTQLLENTSGFFRQPLRVSLQRRIQTICAQKLVGRRQELIFSAQLVASVM
ncbi:MAG: hypothetical protein IV101_03785 [Dechloromonas sp.]|uniref:hypothetical protein n=1 Tax=Dechloromonas sp. TaxID=1917218 RepID=UPI0027ED022F|nr:hypothetical protein [Dechloromonas sp.]MBT9519994.1 hypothetical protein [Dechloromonas sp.]